MLDTIDITSDDSFHKFVWPDIPLNDPNYTPTNLVTIRWECVVNVQELILKKSPSLIREEVLNDLRKLWVAFHDEFNMPMRIQSGFRSFEYQKNIYDATPVKNRPYVAQPQYSEHQTGFAVDVINAQPERTDYNEHFEWLWNVAHMYGFHQSFQKGIEIDWHPIEPWHLRWFPHDFSKYLRDKNISFTEFCKGLTRGDL